mgnify:CR=1 FL=1
MKSVLKTNKEIADYIEENSSEFIDYNLILDYFINCKAILKEVNIRDLKFDNQDHHIKCKQKQESYNNMNSEPPPIVIENNKIIDGHHRVRAAIYNQKEKILAYCIEEIE